ncbi:MAG TPA: hypothetical protein VMK12_09820 [Anaeromyxobacteraceae bacterium]|nr:hypothetical protein [Anaeromyxobacteraceae bacterium]
MSLQDVVGTTVVYRGREYLRLRGHTAHVLAVAGSWLRVVFDLPGDWHPVVEVSPEDVGLFVFEDGPLIIPQ